VTRETWHEGWHRTGDQIFTRCAGCGKTLGVACIAITSDDAPIAEPQWPFDEETCPLCLLRNRLYERDGPPDRLTERMLAMKARKAGG
jgi:hypothetical protein